MIQFMTINFESRPPVREGEEVKASIPDPQFESNYMVLGFKAIG